MTIYDENAPTFHAWQWTGDNQSELTAALETWLQSESTDSTVDENGALMINFAFGGWLIPSDGWIAYGPLYGENSAFAQVTQAMDDMTFNSRFSAQV